MTPEEKEAAKLELRIKMTELKLNTFDLMLYLFKADEAGRKAAGYFKGPEEMILALTRQYEREMAKLMKPFDRGDYD